MARRKSVCRWPNATQQNPIGSLSDDGRVPETQWRCALYPAVVLFLWAAACAAGNTGPGIAFKVGAQTIEHPIDLDKTTRARFELELSSAKLYDDHLDFALTLGGSTLGSISDEDAYWELDEWGYDHFIEESYSDDLFVFDVRLAARLYPLGDNGGIQPYMGAGVGYFWFLDRWEDTYSDTFEDPPFSGMFYTVTGSEEDTDTLAQGFFPFVTAGLTVPVGSNFEMMFEFQYDFEKKDSGFDLGGPIYMFGARFRF